MSDAVTGPTEQARADALALLAWLKATAREADRRQPHAVVETDPETGLVQVYGPYADAAAAATAAAERHRYHAVHTGPPQMQLSIALFHEGTGP